jgi:PST family polysaccharide transporter
MSHSEKTRILLKGTAILAAAAFLSKLLGVLYRIPYQNITGDDGLYVYGQVYPIYSMLLILATAGFPIAISKLVADRLVFGDIAGARKIFSVSAVILGLTGLIFFILLYWGAPLIAKWYMNDEGLIMPIRSVSFALLIVPVMAVIRGYYQGHQNMMPTATSQVVEQIIRVSTILFLSYWFIYHQYDVYYAGSGAVFGAVTGAAAALCVLLFYWRKIKKQQQAMLEEGPKPEADATLHEASITQAEEEVAAQPFKETSGEPADTGKATLTTRAIIKRLFYFAIPICLGSLVLPLYQLVDVMTVPKMLMASGLDFSEAKTLRGILERGQPLVQFSAFFATALSLALVPAIADAYARKDQQLIRSRASMAMRLTLIVGLGASFGLSLLAMPINVMLYITPDGSTTLAILAFVTLFSTISIASGAILQGLGHVMLPARNLFIGVVLKTILNIMFIPIWGISGAALAGVLAYALAAALNVSALYKLAGLRLKLVPFFVKPLIAVLIMSGGVYFSKQGLLNVLTEMISSHRLLHTFISLNTVLIGVILFGVALLKLGAIRRDDLISIPKVNKIIPLFDKLKLLKG